MDSNVECGPRAKKFAHPCISGILLNLLGIQDMAHKADQGVLNLDFGMNTNTNAQLINV